MPTELSKHLAALSARPSVERCREMGRDYARNGPDKNNCHFRLFCSREHTEAWEQGRDEVNDARP